MTSRLGKNWPLGLGCLALVVAFALLRGLAPHIYLFFTRIPDGAAKLHPFVDLHDILLGGQCWRQGVDVYRPSACLGGGVFNYSPLLLLASYLPIGPQDTLVGGLVFCVAYAAALMALPGGPKRLIAAAAFSPVAYYALEQGNLDVLIFAATVLALRLPWRGPGYGIFALGAAAKFYPAAFFLLALREKPRHLAWLAGAGLAGLALVLLFDFHSLVAALVQLPSGTPFRASFGRIDLPRGLAMFGLLPRGSAQAVGWLLALAAFGVAAWRRSAWRLEALPADEALFLVAGAVVISFCFLTAQNIEYRAIFLLLALPGLLRLGRVLPWLVVLLMWEAVPRALLAGLAQPYFPGPLTFCFWLAREAGWWWLVTEFCAICLAYAVPKLTLLAGAVKLPKTVWTGT